MKNNKLACLLITAAAIGAFGVSGKTATASECAYDVRTAFVEGAPVDRFLIQNRSAKGTQIKSANIMLAGSKGKLIFDTIDGGSGVEVFQPYKSGNLAIKAEQRPAVRDGDDRISFSFSNFTADKDFSFTIDVDDQLTQSDLGQIRVSGSEIAGGVIELTLERDGKAMKERLVFDNKARAAMRKGCS